MPYREEYVEPEVFLEFRDVVIYRAYKNQQADEQLSYWYTTDHDENEEYEFDVRKLPKVEGYDADKCEDHTVIIIEAIKSGVVPVKLTEAELCE